MVGDLWQLIATRRHVESNSLPHEWLQTAGAKQRMLQAHGQELIWGGSRAKGFQGVTELWRCERVKDDEWLKELQEQCPATPDSPTTIMRFCMAGQRPCQAAGPERRLPCGNEACRNAGALSCHARRHPTRRMPGGRARSSNDGRGA